MRFNKDKTLPLIATGLKEKKKIIVLVATLTSKPELPAFGEQMQQDLRALRDQIFQSRHAMGSYIATPLHQAVRSNKQKTAELFLEAGIDKGARCGLKSL